MGAHLAGFKTALAIDIDPILSSAFAKNFPKTKLIHEDLSTLNLAARIIPENVVGIIGGPPCQGFSVMGRREKNDPRNKLVSHFFRHVMEVEPAFFVMENVPGILSGDAYKTLQKALTLLGNRYEIVGPIKVNAADFGAATLRTRVLILGFDPKKMRPIKLEEIDAAKNRMRSNVKDAIFDLPSPKDLRDDKKEFDWIDYSPANGMYSIKAAKLPPAGLGYPAAIKQLKNGKISGFLPTTHSELVEKRYVALKPGATDPVSRASRLEWSELCSTLRAGTGSDKGSYQSVRPIHPVESRVITVREAARLQGFPDWFVFHPTKWHSFRMIGNSVSPYLSEAIMCLIASNIKRAKKVGAFV